MKKCFAYIRVSTVKQGEGVSLEAQREAITVFASRQNIEIVQWFEEKETAAKRGRPIFNKMIADLKKRRADGLVVHKIDRFARNLIDYGKISELMDIGIDIHTAIDSLDFQTRGGRLAADVQAVVAADYVRNLREECIKGLTGRLKQGLYPFKAPIGYLDNGGGKVKTLDPDRAHHILAAYELYGSEQYSQRALQEELAKRGLRTKAGHPLSLSGLESVLANPFYCGIIKIKRSGGVYQGCHEPLIPVSLFERVQDIKTGKAVKKMTKHNYTYRRLFRCSLCDGAMIPERQKGRVYYRCQTRNCATKTVREDGIEAAILQCLSTLQLTDANIDKMAQRFTAWIEKRESNSDSSALPLQLAAIADRRERLTDALIDRLIDKETYQNRAEALLIEEARVKEQQQELAAHRANPQCLRNFLELLRNLAQTYYFAAQAEKYRITKIATSNRTVAGKKICVEPSKWLQDVGATVAALRGAPSPCADRTLTGLLWGPIVLELAEIQNKPRNKVQSGRACNLSSVVQKPRTQAELLMS